MTGDKRKSVSKVAACCLLPCGVITLSLALLMGYYVIPYKIWEGVMKESKLIQGDNPRYNAWQKVPIPLYQHIYLFNVTNPEKVVQGEEKPILQQLGPYIYQMKMEKFDIVFNEDNGTFFYRERIDYFFREDLSNGTESDPITFINIPFVGVAQGSTTLNTFTRYILLEIMNEHSKAQLYMHTTVGHLLFQGIPLSFMKDLSDLKGEEILPNNTFGLMYGRNGTNQGRFEIYSGQKQADKFGDIVSWNGQHEYKWWANDQFCKQLNGSDGIFEPYATKDRTYYMFMPGMCRSFPLSFERAVSSDQVFGVPVYKYSVPKTFLANPTDNPENSCYFSDFSEPYPESGVFPMRGCDKGPMMLSQPHFYQGSTVYLNQSVGLSPDKEQHEMSILMEPYTGSPMRVKVRFQMNVDLQPNKYFKSLRKIPKMVHPLFWMDQTSEIPEKDADTIRNKLVAALQIISVVTQVTVIFGALLILISVILFLRCHQIQPKCSPENSRNVSSSVDHSTKKGLFLLRLLFHFKNKHYPFNKNGGASPAASTTVTETLLCPMLPTTDNLIVSSTKDNDENSCPARVSSEETLPFIQGIETDNDNFATSYKCDV